MPRNAKCVVPHCGHVYLKDPRCILLKFPKEIERCREWVRRIGVEDLAILPIEKLTSIRFVCGCHFPADQFINTSKKKLLSTASPSLFDPRIVSLDDKLLMNFPVTYVPVQIYQKISTEAKEVSISEKDLEAIYSGNFQPRRSTNRSASRPNGHNSPGIEVKSMPKPGLGISLNATPCTSSTRLARNTGIKRLGRTDSLNSHLLVDSNSAEANKLSVPSSLNLLNESCMDKPQNSGSFNDEPSHFPTDVEKSVIPERVLRQHSSSDAISGVMNPSTVSERSQSPAQSVRISLTEEAAIDISEKGLDQATPKRGLKRRHRASAKPESTSHSNYEVTITFTDDVEPQCMTFKVESSQKKETVIEKIMALMKELQADSKQLQ